MTKHSTKRSTVCPECGADLSGSSPGVPCAACLMQLGLQSWSAATGASRTGPASGGPSVEARRDVPPDLAERFPQLEILDLLGEGGMGAVYRARQRALNRTVALKVIKSESQHVTGFAERFVREARALGSLSHPNIVTVYDFGQAGDIYYFVMEYVDGIDLRQVLQGDKLKPHQALSIVPAICDALQYAHDRGVVHRDIKPENILVDTDGNVKIADFGLAKLLNEETSGPTLTRTHQVMGTAHYMAPEQIERPLDVDHRADIYSLGVVIYELLTGELPLGRFAPPSKKVSLDIRLDEIVLHSLEKEPSLRYQKASDVKTDVESLSVPSVARPAAQADASGHADQQPGFRRESPPAKPQPFVEDDWCDDEGPFPDNGFWGVLTEAQSYKNLAYLLLSFPLGIIYFVFLVTGFSYRFGVRLVVWIGAFCCCLGTAAGGSRRSCARAFPWPTASCGCRLTRRRAERLKGRRCLSGASGLSRAAGLGSGSCICCQNFRLASCRS